MPPTSDQIREKLLAEIRPYTEDGRAKRDLAAITEQIDLCLTPCKEFNGRVCKLRGTDCKKWIRWAEHLILSTEPCRYFEPQS